MTVVAPVPSRSSSRWAVSGAHPASVRKVRSASSPAFTQVTALLNEHLGLGLTDAFCGFKAYRVSCLRQLHLTEDGYAMPLELWVQAAFHELMIVEVPVPLIYLDEKRSFGGALDDSHAAVPARRSECPAARIQLRQVLRGVALRRSHDSPSTAKR